MFEDIEVHAIKTGMLYDAENTRVIARTLQAHYEGVSMPPLVCDPVCVSTSGHTLLDPDAVEVMIDEIFPIATLITPNMPEAELILSRRNMSAEITSLDDMLTAAKALSSLGPRAVLLKGGHVSINFSNVQAASIQRPDLRIIRVGLLGKNMEILQVAEAHLSDQLVVDVLQIADQTTLYLHPRIDSTSTHGTGCTLSAAITCALASGQNSRSQ